MHRVGDGGGGRHVRGLGYRARVERPRPLAAGDEHGLELRYVGDARYLVVGEVERDGASVLDDVLLHRGHAEALYRPAEYLAPVPLRVDDGAHVVRAHDPPHGHVPRLRVHLDLGGLRRELGRGRVREDGHLLVGGYRHVAAAGAAQLRSRLSERGAARGLAQLRAQAADSLLHRDAEGERRAAARDAEVERQFVGGGGEHRDRLRLDAQLFRDDLPHCGVRALAGVGDGHVQSERGVRVQHEAAAGVAADGAALVQGDAAPDVGGFRPAPAYRLDRGVERLDGLDRAPALAVRGRVAGAQQVPPAELGGVHPQLRRDDVQLRLDREVDLRPAGRAHVAGGERVRVDDVARHVQRGEPVAAAGLLKPVQVDVGGGLERAVRAAVEVRLHLHAGEAAVLRDAGADRDRAGVTGVRREQFLLVRHHDLHRAPRRLREQVGDRSVHRRALAAEVAAHRHRVHADGGRVHAHRGGDLASQHVRALVRRPYVRRAVRVDGDGARVRLHVDVMLLLRDERVLEHAVRARERGLDVAVRPASVGAEVGQGRALRVHERARVLRGVVVDERSVRRERLGDVEDGGQLLVLDLDERERLVRRVRRLRGDGGDALADEAHLVDGEDGQVAHEAPDPVGALRAGEDGTDAGHALGGGGVDAHDAGVGVRAPEHPAPQAVLRGQVSGEAEAPAHLVRPLDARGALADHAHRHGVPPATVYNCVPMMTATTPPTAKKVPRTSGSVMRSSRCRKKCASTSATTGLSANTGETTITGALLSAR